MPIFGLKYRIMKRFLTFIAAALSAGILSAQEVKYHDASELTVIGKPIPTSKDFTRIDTSAYRFSDKVIDEYACHSTGLAVLFATDSPIIRTRWQTSPKNASENMTAIAQKGLDLYIKKDGEWVFAGVGRPEMADGPSYDLHEGTIVKDMAPGRKECLLYLPLYDRLDSLFIGVGEGSYIEPIENPFRYRIVVKGSSVTHGLAASRPGMSYAARFGRDNGFYCFNLGFSGKSKLQEEYARYLTGQGKKTDELFSMQEVANADEVKMLSRRIPVVKKADDHMVAYSYESPNSGWLYVAVPFNWLLVDLPVTVAENAVIVAGVVGVIWLLAEADDDCDDCHHCHE